MTGFNAPPNVKMIRALVAAYYSVTEEQLLGPSRERGIAWPRQMAMALTRELTTLSTTQVGWKFGDRDHSTVIHASAMVARRIERDPRVRHEWVELTRLLRAVSRDMARAGLAAAIERLRQTEEAA